MVVLKYLLSYSITVTHTTTTNQHKVLAMQELTPQIMLKLGEITKGYFANLNKHHDPDEKLTYVSLNPIEHSRAIDNIHMASNIMCNIYSVKQADQPPWFTHVVDIVYKEGCEVYTQDPTYGWVLNMSALGSCTAWLLRYVYGCENSPIYVEKTITL